MASANYYVRLGQQGGGAVYIIGVYDSPQETVTTNLNNINRTDKVYFAKDYFGDSTDYTVTGTNAHWLNSPFPVTVSTSSYDTFITVHYSVAFNTTSNLTFAYANKTNETLSYTVTDPAASSEPNQFTFQDQTNLKPNSSFITRVQVNGFANTLNVSHQDFVNTSINLRVFRERGTSIVETLLDFESGDYIRVTGTAPSGYDTEYVVRFYVGATINDFLQVKTEAEPEIDELIRLEIFDPAPIELKKDVEAFFGGPVNGEPELGFYVKGGDYVPDLAVNSGIPNVKPIELGDLYGAYTAYFFTKEPLSKEQIVNTLAAGNHEANVGWDKRQVDRNEHDWRIGYGDNLELGAKYKYDVIHYHEHPVNEVTINSNNSMDHTVLSTNNTYINLSATVPQNTEKIYWGKIIIHAQNVHDLSGSTITREVSWALIFYAN